MNMFFVVLLLFCMNTSDSIQSREGNYAKRTNAMELLDLKGKLHKRETPMSSIRKQATSRVKGTCKLNSLIACSKDSDCMDLGPCLSAAYYQYYLNNTKQHQDYQTNGSNSINITMKDVDDKNVTLLRNNDTTEGIPIIQHPKEVNLTDTVKNIGKTQYTNSESGTVPVSMYPPEIPKLPSEKFCTLNVDKKCDSDEDCGSSGPCMSETKAEKIEGFVTPMNQLNQTKSNMTNINSGNKNSTKIDKVTSVNRTPINDTKRLDNSVNRTPINGTKRPVNESTLEEYSDVLKHPIFRNISVVSHPQSLLNNQNNQTTILPLLDNSPNATAWGLGYTLDPRVQMSSDSWSVQPHNNNSNGPLRRRDLEQRNVRKSNTISPNDGVAIRAALWKAVQINDIVEVRRLIGLSTLSQKDLNLKNKTRHTKDGITTETAVKIPVLQWGGIEPSASRRLSSYLYNGGVCKSRPMLRCLKDDECHEYAPCVTGVCAFDIELRCVQDAECREKGPCLQQSDLGHCKLKWDQPCMNDPECQKFGPCTFGGEGICQKDENRPCSRDQHCFSFGPCSFDGIGHCVKDMSRGCSKNSHCFENGPCAIENGTGYCSQDPDIPCQIDLHCVDKAPCLLPGACYRNEKIGCSGPLHCKVASPTGGNDTGPCSPTGWVGKCALEPQRKCKLQSHCEPGNVGPCLDGSDNRKESPTGGKATADGECCLCLPLNPDARWPGVNSSPIGEAMGLKEYVWGKKGDPEPKNPVRRKNQPRWECCPCSDNPDTGNGAAKTGRGVCINSKDKNACNTQADCAADEKPCLFGGKGFCDKKKEITCSADMHCNPDFGPCMMPGKGTCVLDTRKTCDSDQDCDKVGPCGFKGEGHCVKKSSKSCGSDNHCIDRDAGDLGPCAFLGAGFCRKIWTRQCNTDKHCIQIKSDGTSNNLGPCDIGTCTHSSGHSCSVDKDCFVKSKDNPKKTTDVGPCKTGAHRRDTCRRAPDLPCISDKECGTRGPCMSGQCSLDRLRGCAVDLDCGNTGPCLTGICKESTDIACLTDGECNIPNKEVGGVVKTDIGPCVSGWCKKDQTIGCDLDSHCGDSGPCSILTRGFIPALQRAIKASELDHKNSMKTFPHSKSANMTRIEATNAVANAMQEKSLLTKRMRPDLQGPAMQACNFLGIERCKEMLGDAYNSSHVDVVTAFKVLRSGDATSACLGFGWYKCTESLKEAKDRQHEDVVLAIKELTHSSKKLKERILLSKEMVADTRLRDVARLQRLNAPQSDITEASVKAAVALEESLRSNLQLLGVSASSTKASISPPEIVAKAREKQAKSLLRDGSITERQFEYMRRDMHAWLLNATRIRNPQNYTIKESPGFENNYADVFKIDAGSGTRFGFNGTTNERGGPLKAIGNGRPGEKHGGKDNITNSFRFHEDSMKLKRLYQLEHLEMGSQMWPNRTPIDSYGPPLFFSNSTGTPLTLDMCNGEKEQTADCYCRVLGPKLCGESLFLAYLQGHSEVIAAIRSTLRGNSTSMALTMCRALGPNRCRKTLAEAVRSNDIAVVAAWRFLVNGTLAFPAMNVLGNTLAPNRCNNYTDCSDITTCIGGRCLEPRGSECMSHNDCVQGRKCIEKRCFAKQPCTRTSMCTFDERCIGGHCAEITPGVPCARREDCGFAQECRNWKCMRVAKLLSCKRSIDCGHGQTCGLFQTCIPRPPWDCASDNDCPFKTTMCNVSEGKCVPKTRTVTTGGECTSPAQCTLPGQTCRYGKCIIVAEGAPCVSTEGCGAGFACDLSGGSPGTCRGPIKIGSLCTGGPGTGSCASGQVCRDGVCVLAPSVGSACKGPECGSGKMCVEGFCVYAPVSLVIPPCKSVPNIDHGGVFANPGKRNETEKDSFDENKCSGVMPMGSCTYNCKENFEIPPGISNITNCRLNSTWSEEPPKCTSEFTCAPNRALLREDTCKAKGICSCSSPVLPGTKKPPKTLDSTTCVNCEDEGTGDKCTWTSDNEWLRGKGKMALFWAIQDRNRRGVQFLLDSGADPNIRLGIEGCLDPTMTFNTTEEKETYKKEILASPWCESASMKRAVDVADEVGPERTASIIRSAGGIPGNAEMVYPFKWESVVEAWNRTADEKNFGIHGHLQFLPWWQCTNRNDRKRGKVGCYPHAYDWGDYNDLACDPDTGLNCECDEEEPPDSPYTCEVGQDPDTGGKTRIKKGKFKKGKHREGTNRERKPKGFKRPTGGKIGQPGDCDWNPFTNLPYFLFCIILKVLKPLFTMSMLETGASSNQLMLPYQPPVVSNSSISVPFFQTPMEKNDVYNSYIDTPMVITDIYPLANNHFADNFNSYNGNKSQTKVGFNPVLVKYPVDFSNTWNTPNLTNALLSSVIVIEPERFSNLISVLEYRNRTRKGNILQYHSFTNLNITGNKSANVKLNDKNIDIIRTSGMGAMRKLLHFNTRSTKRRHLRGAWGVNPSSVLPLDETLRIQKNDESSRFSELRNEQLRESWNSGAVSSMVSATSSRNGGSGKCAKSKATCWTNLDCPTEDTCSKINKKEGAGFQDQSWDKSEKGVDAKDALQTQMATSLENFGGDKNKRGGGRQDTSVGGSNAISEKGKANKGESDKSSNDSSSSSTIATTPRTNWKWSGKENMNTPGMSDFSFSPMDHGRGIFVFGGMRHDYDKFTSGQNVYLDEAWYYRLGWNETTSEVTWYGHFWLPTALLGTKPSPRAGHTSVVVAALGSGDSEICFEDVEQISATAKRQASDPRNKALEEAKAKAATMDVHDEKSTKKEGECVARVPSDTSECTPIVDLDVCKGNIKCKVSSESSSSAPVDQADMFRFEKNTSSEADDTNEIEGNNREDEDDEDDGDDEHPKPSYKTILIFGGYNGTHFFNDLYSVFPIEESSQQLAKQMDRLKMPNDTDIFKKRASTFDYKHFLQHEGFKRCVGKFNDTDTGSIIEGAAEWCLGFFALPWEGEPWVRTLGDPKRNDSRGNEWADKPRFRKVLPYCMDTKHHRERNHNTFQFRQRRTRIRNKQPCMPTSYRGCYLDCKNGMEDNNRALPTMAGIMSKQECEDSAKNSFAKFYGLQGQDLSSNNTRRDLSQCWIGNSTYDTMGKSDDCNIYGLQTRIAYGKNCTNAVYEVEVRSTKTSGIFECKGCDEYGGPGLINCKVDKITDAEKDIHETLTKQCFAMDNANIQHKDNCEKHKSIAECDTQLECTTEKCSASSFIVSYVTSNNIANCSVKYCNVEDDQGDAEKALSYEVCMSIFDCHAYSEGATSPRYDSGNSQWRRGSKKRSFCHPIGNACVERGIGDDIIEISREVCNSRTLPAPRYRHASTVIGPYMIIHGGMGATGFLNDTRIFDTRNSTWLAVYPSGNSIPPSRAGHSMTGIGTRVIIFGGYSGSAGLFNDVYVLETGCKKVPPNEGGGFNCGEWPNMKWRSVKIDGPRPSARFGHRSVSAIDSSMMLSVGGYGAGSDNQDWRKRRNMEGLRNEMILLDVLVPNVTSVFPRQGSPSGYQTDNVTWYKGKPYINEVIDSSGNVLIKKHTKLAGRLKMQIRGRSLGNCPKPYATVNGIQRCNTTCTDASCNESVWHSNNNNVMVTIGKKKCDHITWYSPNYIECEVPPGVGKLLNVVVWAFGQSTSTDPPNRLWSYDPPKILDILPSFVLDFPGVPRGPLIIQGKNFGSPELDKDELMMKLTIGGQACLKFIHVSDTTIICLCVARRDKNQPIGSEAKGGMTVSIGGQEAVEKNKPAIISAPVNFAKLMKRQLKRRGSLVRCPEADDMARLLFTPGMEAIQDDLKLFQEEFKEDAENISFSGSQDACSDERSSTRDDCLSKGIWADGGCNPDQSIKTKEECKTKRNWKVQPAKCSDDTKKNKADCESSASTPITWDSETKSCSDNKSATEGECAASQAAAANIKWIEESESCSDSKYSSNKAKCTNDLWTSAHCLNKAGGTCEELPSGGFFDSTCTPKYEHLSSADYNCKKHDCNGKLIFQAEPFDNVTCTTIGEWYVGSTQATLRKMVANTIDAQTAERNAIIKATNITHKPLLEAYARKVAFVQTMLDAKISIKEIHRRIFAGLEKLSLTNDITARNFLGNMTALIRKDMNIAINATNVVNENKMKTEELENDFSAANKTFTDANEKATVAKATFEKVQNIERKERLDRSRVCALENNREFDGESAQFDTTDPCIVDYLEKRRFELKEARVDMLQLISAANATQSGYTTKFFAFNKSRSLLDKVIPIANKAKSALNMTIRTAIKNITNAVTDINSFKNSLTNMSGRKELLNKTAELGKDLNRTSSVISFWNNLPTLLDRVSGATNISRGVLPDDLVNGFHDADFYDVNKDLRGLLDAVGSKDVVGNILIDLQKNLDVIKSRNATLDDVFNALKSNISESLHGNIDVEHNGMKKITKLAGMVSQLSIMKASMDAASATRSKAQSSNITDSLVREVSKMQNYFNQQDIFSGVIKSLKDGTASASDKETIETLQKTMNIAKDNANLKVEDETKYYQHLLISDLDDACSAYRDKYQQENSGTQDSILLVGEQCIKRTLGPDNSSTETILDEKLWRKPVADKSISETENTDTSNNGIIGSVVKYIQPDGTDEGKRITAKVIGFEDNEEKLKESFSKMPYYVLKLGDSKEVHTLRSQFFIKGEEGYEDPEPESEVSPESIADAENSKSDTNVSEGANSNEDDAGNKSGENSENSSNLLHSGSSDTETTERDTNSGSRTTEVKVGPEDTEDIMFIETGIDTANKIHLRGSVSTVYLQTEKSDTPSRFSKTPPNLHTWHVWLSKHSMGIFKNLKIQEAKQSQNVFNSNYSFIPSDFMNVNQLEALIKGDRKFPTSRRRIPENTFANSSRFKHNTGTSNAPICNLVMDHGKSIQQMQPCHCDKLQSLADLKGSIGIEDIPDDCLGDVKHFAYSLACKKMWNVYMKSCSPKHMRLYRTSGIHVIYNQCHLLKFSTAAVCGIVPGEDWKSPFVPSNTKSDAERMRFMRSKFSWQRPVSGALESKLKEIVRKLERRSQAPASFMRQWSKYVAHIQDDNIIEYDLFRFRRAYDIDVPYVSGKTYPMTSIQIETPQTIEKQIDIDIDYALHMSNKMANMPVSARWIQPNFLCSVGKPMLPRRSFGIMKVGMGDKFILFFGEGINDGPLSMKVGDKSSIMSNSTFGILPLPPRDLNDTFILTDLYKASEDEKLGYGLQLMSCNGHQL